MLALLLAVLVALPGCGWHKPRYRYLDDVDHYKKVATHIEAPDCGAPCNAAAATTPPPRTLKSSAAPKQIWNLSLEEAIQTALGRSQVVRDVGALVLRAPAAARTVYDPAIQETDPRFGVEAALSAFDANLTYSAFFEKNDRALNNQFFGGGARILEQDLATFETALSKRAATGTEFTIRHNTDYDANNAPANLFPSAWNTNFETEFRHPLLQGGGAEFNRIAGPGAVPGLYNGVLIARINTDVSLADFEMSVRNLVSDVENAYWDLYFAYRDLDAKIAARDRALETWRIVRERGRTGREGGEAEFEAQAREQYYRLAEEVQNALSGRLTERTRTVNFQVNGGVHAAERRLRLLMGLPANDAEAIIRPADEPTLARVVFDWEEIIQEALARRAELRRQKWEIKRRELELVASRNFLRPRLDAVGRYRWRGFGHDLLRPDREGRGQFDNAFMDLTTGDFQEWQLGFEFSMPLGYRRAHAGVRNAELQLARARALLLEQEHEVVHDLSAAIEELDRAYATAQTNYNRRLAARRQLAILQEKDEQGFRINLDQLLDAQRRLSDAESRYYRSLVEYSLAIKHVHFHKGSLLDFNEVFLAEGPWPGKAYHDAARRNAWRSRPLKIRNYTLSAHRLAKLRGKAPPVVSCGPYGQEVAGPALASGAQPVAPPQVRAPSAGQRPRPRAAVVPPRTSGDRDATRSAFAPPADVSLSPDVARAAFAPPVGPDVYGAVQVLRTGTAPPPAGRSPGRR